VFYASNQGNPLLRSVLAGIGAAAVGLLAAVTLQIGGKQLQHLLDLTIVAITVLLVSVFHVPLLMVLATVGPVAIYLYRPRPARPPVADSTGCDKKGAD
jgi:chromate transporter